MGTSGAQSTAGLSQAERVEAREKGRAARPAERRREEPDEVVVNTESLEAIRSLKDNTQEEAHADRRGKGQYQPDGSVSRAPSPQIDVEG